MRETTLYFKPDPAQSQGPDRVQPRFRRLPGLLNLDPGVNTRFYTVLTVEDSAAPTRRISTGVEYTQVLPIHFENMKVVRPVLQGEERVKLRWKVMLNGLTFQTPDAPGPELALQPIIDQGGVGDYKIVLEVRTRGRVAADQQRAERAAGRASRPPRPRPAADADAGARRGHHPRRRDPTAWPPTRRPTPARRRGSLPTQTVTPTLDRRGHARPRRRPTGPMSSGPTSTRWLRANVRTSSGRWRT